MNDLKSKEDQRIEFIWEALSEMKASLNSLSSDITVIHGDPIHAIPLLLKKYDLLFASVPIRANPPDALTRMALAYLIYLFKWPILAWALVDKQAKTKASSLRSF